MHPLRWQTLPRQAKRDPAPANPLTRNDSIMMFSARSTQIRRIAHGAYRVAFAVAVIAAGEACAQSAVQGVPNAMQGFSQNRDQPIQIEAATLEMRDKKKEATFAGNVKVVQGDTTMTSKILVVFYDSTTQQDLGRHGGVTLHHLHIAGESRFLFLVAHLERGGFDLDRLVAILRKSLHGIGHALHRALGTGFTGGDHRRCECHPIGAMRDPPNQSAARRKHHDRIISGWRTWNVSCLTGQGPGPRTRWRTGRALRRASGCP